MTWDSFRQRVRYLRGEALGNWPSSITNVVLQPIWRPLDTRQQTGGGRSSTGNGGFGGSDYCHHNDGDSDSECVGVHVWCIGSLPSHGMRRGSLLHCSVPAITSTIAEEEEEAQGVEIDGFRVPVAALRSVWMDPDCHVMMECESLALLRYLQTAAIERLLWQEDTGMVLLADKGRRWIEGRVEFGYQQVEGGVISNACALFTDCSVSDSASIGHKQNQQQQQHQPFDGGAGGSEQMRENDWYYERGGADGRFVAFSRSGNVVVYDTISKQETQVTWAAAESGVQYGAVDVAMEEELGRTAGIFWAPSQMSRSTSSSLSFNFTVDRMLCARLDERGVMGVGLPEPPPSLAGDTSGSNGGGRPELSASTITAPAKLFADDQYEWDTGCAYRNNGEEGERGGGSDSSVRLTDFQKYPRPGTMGAKTDWVIVEIEHAGAAGIVRHRIRPLYERFRLAKLFPWCEYVVRAGWMPVTESSALASISAAGSSSHGGAIWLQLLDRAQKHTAVVRVPLGCFAPGVDGPLDPLDDESSSSSSYITGDSSLHSSSGAVVDILYEEEQPNAWINLNHSLRFLSACSTHTAIRFILASERTGGFSHLYLVTAHINSQQQSQRLSSPAKTSSLSGTPYVRRAQQEILPLTSGKWPVTDDAPVFVDEKRMLVYFSARRPNPLTTNLYAVSYNHHLSTTTAAVSMESDPEMMISSAPAASNKLWQLTCNGYTHSHFVFDPAGMFFYCQSSNLTTLVRHCIYMISHHHHYNHHHRQTLVAPAVSCRSSNASYSQGLASLRRNYCLQSSNPRSPVGSVIDSLYGEDDDDYAVCSTPDGYLSDSMSFYSAVCEPNQQQHQQHQQSRELRHVEPTPSAQCVCVMEISGAPLLRSHPLLSPDPVSVASGSTSLRRMSSIRKPATSRVSVCSSSSSLISLSSQSQSVDSIASDEMFVEKLLSKLRTSGQSIQHSTLASDLLKLKRLTPAYVSQRVTKAVRSALPFCSTPTILPRHLLHSSLLQPLTGGGWSCGRSAANGGGGIRAKPTPPIPPSPAAASVSDVQQSRTEDVGVADTAASAPRASKDGIAQKYGFASSLTAATRSFSGRETLLGIDGGWMAADDGMQQQLHTPGGDPVPRLFCVPVMRHRGEYELVFGHVYLPPDFKCGEQYPTVVNAYGGPQCQLVTNAYPYPRHRRLAMLTRMTPAVARPGSVPEFVPRDHDGAISGVGDYLATDAAAPAGSATAAARAIAKMRAMVVVCIDGRGTPHRGLSFESAIQGRLGRLEVDDIVSALEYLCTYGPACLEPVRGVPPAWCQHTMSAAIAEQKAADGTGAGPWSALWRPPVFAPPGTRDSHDGVWDPAPALHLDPGARRVFIDRSRIAIHGWSYGGYVALRALARHPEWFGVAVAGAPVVRWDWYSAAYIERYLGVLDAASRQKYHDASVLAVADKLLQSSSSASSSSAAGGGRILLVHGWNDDNVHVAHTAALVRELRKRGSTAASTATASASASAAAKLCIYANERHGLRLPSSNEHFETLLSFWLFHFLQQQQQ
ncbi:hypothetical protein IWW48_003851 [Coemansia sp. RSA 1200]|nr:hypothetical protein IWW48_003851 [Coemansia sp. RSA 1200]